MIHSPFHVVEDFISAQQCELLIRALALQVPDYAATGEVLKYERSLPVECTGNILSQLYAQEPLISHRYQGVIGEPNLLFQQYWENAKAPAEPIGCENSKFLRKKWTKFKDVDLVGFLWLKNWHNSVPMDPRYEVYGGKIEFPGYNFSLTPVRGTLVLFPATPHFVTAISHVLLGSLEQIKITMKLTCNEASWSYVAANYPGSYQEWFVNDGVN